MKSAHHRGLLLALLIALAPAARADSPADLALDATLRGDHREASRQYLLAAQGSRGATAVEYQLRAAESLCTGGDCPAGATLLQRLPPSALEGRFQQRASLLRAEARLSQNDFASALQALPNRIDRDLAPALLDLRARAQFGAGDVAGGTGSRVVRSALLPEAERAPNRDLLWQELGRAPLADAALATDPVVRGWLELARLAREHAPLSAYEAWRQRNADHPGEALLPTLSLAAAPPPAAAAMAAPAGRDFALLLPLSGPLAAAAQAIRAGAEAARGQAGEDAPVLSVHDSNGGLDAAVQQALSAGAGLLIGPLRKEDVAQLAAQPTGLPVLALNYLDAGRVPPAGFTPFGLAPEDEARAAAEHAVARGHRRAVVIAQEGDWGERIAQAFRRELEARGGTVVAESRFRANAVDFSAQLKSLLALDAAEGRAKQLAAIGIRAESAPRPRGDIDSIFVGARAAQARLIWPQLRFFRAGRIPTYAPASAADAGTADLGGLQVCDAPWRLATTGDIADLRGTLAAVNPRTADAQRLFALGFDAYRTAQRLQAGSLAPGEALSGLSGTLVIEADAALHRRLDCVTLVAPIPVSEDAE